jgi:hypothetical protein
MELAMLTAQNAMASPVVVFPEIARVDFLVGVLDNTSHNGANALLSLTQPMGPHLDNPSHNGANALLSLTHPVGPHLDNTSHNGVKDPTLCWPSHTARDPPSDPPSTGFPVVRIDKTLISGDADHVDQATVVNSKAKFCGLVLRRQLIVLLQERIWELQADGDHEVPQHVIERFVGSFTSFADENLGAIGTAKLAKLTRADMAQLLDLRPFLDPSPLTVGRLMPLQRMRSPRIRTELRQSCVCLATAESCRPRHAVVTALASYVTSYGRQESIGSSTRSACVTCRCWTRSTASVASSHARTCTPSRWSSPSRPSQTQRASPTTRALPPPPTLPPLPTRPSRGAPPPSTPRSRALAIEHHHP